MTEQTTDRTDHVVGVADHVEDDVVGTTEEATEEVPGDSTEEATQEATRVGTDDVVEDVEHVQDGRDHHDVESDQDDLADEVSVETGEDGAAVARPSRKQLLEREGEVAADFLETLLDICDLDGDLDVDIDGDRAAVSIVDSEEGRVPRRLVGDNGKVLDALQELTRLAVQTATGERTRLILDIAGHRADRRTRLVAIAREAIDEAKASGEPQSLKPMSAYERKIVHDEVLAAGLSSESEGVEPRRYVVITSN